MNNQEIFWGNNIRFLRTRKRMTQDDLANALEIKRSKLNAQESGVTKNPPLEDLLKCSRYFHISVDILLKVDLSRVSELKIREFEAGSDNYIKGSDLRVLTTTVDRKNNEHVEYVAKKAKAGYVTSYNDPEFIEGLPKFSMPMLAPQKTYRAFVITGDSMPPFKEGDVVFAEFVQDWYQVKDHTLCIVLARDSNQDTQDLVFKSVVNKLAEKQALELHSFNPEYQPYEVLANDITEVWRYHSYWSKDMPDNTAVIDEIASKVKEIDSAIRQWKLRQ